LSPRYRFHFDGDVFDLALGGGPLRRIPDNDIVFVGAQSAPNDRPLRTEERAAPARESERLEWPTATSVSKVLGWVTRAVSRTRALTMSTRGLERLQHGRRRARSVSPYARDHGGSTRGGD
jgi:hypothetical protein